MSDAKPPAQFRTAEPVLFSVGDIFRALAAAQRAEAQAATTRIYFDPAQQRQEEE